MGDLASKQAVTRVNAEQASKRVMRRPTRLNNGEGCHHGVQRSCAEEAKSTSDQAPWLRRGNGDGMHTQEDVRNTGLPRRCGRVTRNRTPRGIGRAGEVAERFVVATKPGNSGGAKGPQFKDNAGSDAGPGD
jgi:hypothetical protein